MRRAPLAPAVLAAALLSGCVSLGFQQWRVLRPPAPAAVARLEPGRSDLAAALALLGAPAEVAEEGDGAVLTWAWDEGDSYGLSLSVPLGHGGSASIAWRDADALGHRLRLRFDASWNLVQVVEEEDA
ncbi:MAG: hypothetical protein D6702_03765 [Planctomycetota bacterium]|nr:MAG: hypothetical protein D6702_03765 [Planctomycetota bacterium]